MWKCRPLRLNSPPSSPSRSHCIASKVPPRPSSGGAQPKRRKAYPLSIIHYTLYIIHYPLYIIHYPLYIIHYTLSIIHYLNLHTHHPLPEGECTVPSFGLHPWFLDSHRLTDELSTLKQQLINTTTRQPSHSLTGGARGGSSFIGECGLDRVCATPYDLQLAAFEAQIALSEELQRPIILHCVRALDDVLRLKRGTTQPWIWHGFRGKPLQLDQLLDHGFFISFGFLHHADSLRACPSDRLFLETDDVPEPIAPLYATAAHLRGTTPEALNDQIWHNLLEKVMP